MRVLELMLTSAFLTFAQTSRLGECNRIVLYSRKSYNFGVFSQRGKFYILIAYIQTSSNKRHGKNCNSWKRLDTRKCLWSPNHSELQHSVTWNYCECKKDSCGTQMWQNACFQLTSFLSMKHLELRASMNFGGRSHCSRYLKSVFVFSFVVLNCAVKVICDILKQDSKSFVFRFYCYAHMCALRSPDFLSNEFTNC